MPAGGSAGTDPGSVGTWDGWISRSVEATERAGEALAQGLEVGDVIALMGPLGAGKTRLVAGIARGLGCRGGVRSPTFTLILEYPGRLTLAHADLYRVEAGEVSTLGLEEHRERGALVVEWGEKLPRALLEEALRLHLELYSGTERMIGARLDTARGRGLGLLEEWSRALKAADRTPVEEAAGRPLSGRDPGS